MKAAKCPICGKPTDPKHKAFCSPRCADIDLQRWLSGRYVVPGSEDSEGATGVEDEED
jgi:endogenous inhibitor of DNA gyrase (YacG/DUF329 family)